MVAGAPAGRLSTGAAGSVRRVPHRPPRPLRLVGALAFLLLLATGCEVRIHTTVSMSGNGHGTVTQAVGFDDAALARVGDLDQQVAGDDLRAAGWVIDPAVKEGDITWVRAHHAFSSPAQATALVAQLSGPDGPYRDVRVTRSDGLLSNDETVEGVIDPTAGFSMFGDPALTTTVGGDGTGGLLDRIAAQEGRPAADMVTVSFTAELPGLTRTTDVSFSDTRPTAFRMDSSTSKLLDLLGTLVVLLLMGATIAVVGLRIRARRLRTRRLMRRSRFQS